MKMLKNGLKLLNNFVNNIYFFIYIIFIELSKFNTTDGIRTHEAEASRS